MATLIFPLPFPVLIVIAGIVAGLVGLGTGYLTLRLRGAFFAIATLALAVVLQTLVRQLGFRRRRRAAPMSSRPKVEISVLQWATFNICSLLMLVLVVVSLTVRG